MKFKNKVSVLALFSLILIFSLSIASAEEITEDIDLGYDDAISMDESIEGLAIDDNEDELGAGNTIYISPEGTGSGSSAADPTNWNDALSNAGSGDTIQFANGTYYNIKGDILKNLNLRGSGNTVLDAQNNGGFFTIGSTKYSYSIEVALSDLSFVNAYTGEKQGNPDGPKTGFDGEGAIVNGGILTVTNCYFASNQGIGTEGGAIHNAGTCYIYDSTFFSNGGKKGGAIYSDKGSSLYIYNSLIHKCVSKEGSAVHAKEAYVEIHNTSVQNASAKNGLFYIKKSTVYFYDSHFYNCKAVDAAAVINIDKESNVQIDNCTFEKLSSTGSKLWFHEENGTGNGGAIVVEKDSNSLLIKNSVFKDCSAKGEGGAIYIQSNSRITIDNCTFKSNTAGEGGNHIYTYGSPYYFSISNSNFEIASSIETSDIGYGQVENVIVTYDVGTNGVLNPTINLLLDGEVKSAINNPGSITLRDLALGDHKVTLSATDSYSNSYSFTQSSSLFVVGDEDINAIVSYSIADDGLINVKVTDEYGRDVVNKNINVTIDGNTYELTTDKDGRANFKPDSIVPGEYEISVVVDGNAISPSTPSKITIPDMDSPISDNVNVSYSYGADGSIAINVVDENGRVIANADLTVTINDKEYKATTDSEGVAKIYPADIDVGEYKVDIRISGKNVIYASSDSIKILPSSTVSSIIAQNIKRAVNSNIEFEARLFDSSGNPLNAKKIVFILNGNEYEVVTDALGYAVFKNSLVPGKYLITVQNPATSEEITRSIEIVNRISGNKNVNVDYSYSATYKVRVFADDGNPCKAGENVVFKIDGKNAKTVKTDANGYATLKIKDNKLLVKTHTITAEYKGVKVSNKLVVKQILKSKNMKYKRYNAKKFTATLKTSKGKAIKGKKVTFKIRGKKYTAKTSKKGVAKIKIRGLTKVGKYKITISYLKDSIKKTVTVKR